MKVRIIWTALPQGVLGDHPVGRLSTVASVRITDCLPQTPLAQAGPIAHWPELVQQASFSALFADGSTVPFEPEQPAPPAGTTPEQTPGQWWDALFPGDVPIDAFAFETRDPGDFLSADSRPLVDAIDALYGDWGIAALRGGQPTLDDLGRDLQTFFDGADDSFRLARRRYDAYTDALHAAGQRVLSSAEREQQEKWLTAGVAELAEVLDFHARLAAIGRTPPLLHKLRLALTAEIELSPEQLSTGGTVGIVAHWPEGAFEPGVLLPDGVAAVGFDHRFAAVDSATAAPAGIIAREGFCDLEASRITAHATDVDGAMRKLKAVQVSAANQVAAGVQHVAEMTAIVGSREAEGFLADRFGNTPAGPPALLTDGIHLNVDREAQLTASFYRQATLQQLLETEPVAAKPGSEGLDNADRMVWIETPDAAQMVIKGWRIDVREVTSDGPGNWRSLHRRTARIEVDGGLEPLIVPDEGCVTTASVQQQLNPKQGETNLVHPSLAIWRGWSLSVPMPSRTIGPSLGDGVDVADPSNPVTPGLHLSVEHSRAEGLPRFRYGRRYQFRMRVMDLAGGGPTWDEQDTPSWAVTDPVLATRAMPVASPVPTFVRGAVAGSLPEGPMAGGSIERMVIRSLVGQTHGLCRRLFYPARVGVGVAEFHAMLDRPDGGIDPDLYGTLRHRDHVDGTADTEGTSHLTAEPVALEWDVTSAGFPALAPVSDEKAATDKVPTQLVMSEAREPVTYLPDPAARGIGFRLEPIRRSSVPALPDGGFDFGDDWLGRRPLLVALVAGDGVPELVDGTLTIPLPPGQATALILSSRVSSRARDGLYVAEQAKRRLDPGSTLGAALDEAIDTGSHPMAAPPRRIELVHAVQRPLTPATPLPRPVMPGTAPVQGMTLRRAGRRDAVVRITASVHCNTTGEVSVTASWHLPTDDSPNDPATDPGLEVVHSSPAFTYRLGPADLAEPDLAGQPLSTAALSIEGRHSLPDTRYRSVGYQLEAVTRFREYLPSALRQQPGELTAAPESAHSWVLSSSVPPPPIVAYVVPTFAWRSLPSTTADTVRRTRRGGGLRVYLARPWFVTGFNEMLAIVQDIAQTSTDDGSQHKGPEENQAEAQRHTVVGQDPLYTGRSVPPAVALNFLRQEDPKHPPAWWSTEAGQWHAKERALLPKAPLRTRLRPVWSTKAERTKDVALYPVEWDADRGLWFADIVVETDPHTAYPMIRLALARYQPMSVPMITNGVLAEPGAPPVYADTVGMAALPADPSSVQEDFDRHLSQVVMTDFCQLLPDRTCAVTRNPDGSRTVVVTGLAGSTPDNPGTPAGPEPRLRFSVILEQLDSGADPVTGWRASEAEVQSLDNPPAGALLAVSVVGPATPDGTTVRMIVVEKDLDLAPVDTSVVQGKTISHGVDRLVYFDAFDIPDSLPGVDKP